MIGDRLNISYETVRSHIKKIYEKLHVASLTEAVAKAINQANSLKKLIDHYVTWLIAYNYSAIQPTDHITIRHLSH